MSEETKVFIVFKITDISDFTDVYGENAGEGESIEGVYSNQKKAEDALAEFERIDQEDVERFGCEPCRFESREYVVH